MSQTKNSCARVPRGAEGCRKPAWYAIIWLYWVACCFFKRSFRQNSYLLQKEHSYRCPNLMRLLKNRSLYCLVPHLHIGNTKYAHSYPRGTPSFLKEGNSASCFTTLANRGSVPYPWATAACSSSLLPNTSLCRFCVQTWFVHHQIFFYFGNLRLLNRFLCIFCLGNH